MSMAESQPPFNARRALVADTDFEDRQSTTDHASIPTRGGAMIATSPQFAAVTGVGVMGGAIAARLLKEGHHIVTFDPDAAKIAALVEKGALAATSPREAARA